MKVCICNLQINYYFIHSCSIKIQKEVVIEIENTQAPQHCACKTYVPSLLHKHYFTIFLNHFVLPRAEDLNIPVWELLPSTNFKLFSCWSSCVIYSHETLHISSQCVWVATVPFSTGSKWYGHNRCRSWIRGLKPPKTWWSVHQALLSEHHNSTGPQRNTTHTRSGWSASSSLAWTQLMNAMTPSHHQRKGRRGKEKKVCEW